MGQTTRHVENCENRLPLSSDGEFYCSLLAEISGVVDRATCAVGRDACTACCASFPPSVRHLNPVVASLLHALGSRIVASGGMIGCDRARAEEMMALAERNLPFDDDLSTPVAESARRTSAAEISLDSLVPISSRHSGPSISRWAVGVTTSRREVPTLADCLPTLLGAGWARPRLFVDGEMEIPDHFSVLPRTDRLPSVGAWPNYYLSLIELMMREPNADAYLLVQDDVLFGGGIDLRAYLERALWPGPPGIASLFCSRGYTQPRNGWHRMHKAWRFGALAFVFCREAAQAFLADRAVVLHRWSRRRNGLADISWLIGQWAFSADIPVYFTTPSLVQHVGDVSTVWPNARAFGNRRASRFVGDTFTD